MLQDITKKLHETAIAVDGVFSDIVKKQAILDGKEVNLKARETATEQKEAELRSREIAVSGIEANVEYRKKAGMLADQAAKEIATLNDDKNRFRKEVADKTSQLDIQARELNTEAKRLADLKATLDAERAKLDIDKENYKEDVIRGMASNISATIKK